MAAGGSSQKNFKKAIAAIKDTTSVGMAKVNGEYKELSVSILKATNHVEVLPKEKHVRTILGAVSGSRPRADVAYCMHMLTRRLAKTRSWVVALKTLIVIHRAIREVDPSFCEELIHHNRSTGHFLNLLHFHDDSNPSAWDYSAWIRAYALYIEEYLECFRALKYDFYRDHSRTKKFDPPALLEQLPALQQLLFRLLGCQPAGAAQYNYIIHYALSIVAVESVRLYVAITDGVLVLVDKYFEMPRHDAVRALEIYRKSVEQAHSLSEFFEMCRRLDFGRGQKFITIEQPPTSFLEAMEQYIKDPPQTLMLPAKADDDESITPKLSDVPEADAKQASTEESSQPSADSQESTKPEKSNTDAPPLIPDLLSWDEPRQEEASLVDDKDSLTTQGPEISSQPDGWELVPVTETNSNVASVAESKKQSTVPNVLDRSTLDSLYDVALTKPNTNGAYQMANVSSIPFEADGSGQDMFYDPSLVVYPNFMQMEAIPQQQQDHQQNPALVAYDYMQIAGITQSQQPAFTEQQHSPFAGQDFMQMTEQPQSEASKQQQLQQPQQQQQALPQEKPMPGPDPTNPFGNPFVDQNPLPGMLPSQSSNLSFL